MPYNFAPTCFKWLANATSGLSVEGLLASGSGSSSGSEGLVVLDAGLFFGSEGLLDIGSAAILEYRFSNNQEPNFALVDER